MSAQSEDGRHEGYVMYVFADEMSGSGWEGGPIADTRPDGTRLDRGARQPRTVDEIVGWFAVCTDDHGRECWRGPIWDRVTDPADHLPEARRVYSGPEHYHSMPDDCEDLAMDDWSRHYAPFHAVLPVQQAAAEVADAQRALTEAVREARAQGASWETIGRAAGMSRQSAHERWSKLKVVR
ncbi:hypothetical protein [Nocardia sp. NPDC057353]|uniref:hypothetical protein n=1 Tax=Nocardia sp. NPDC057353 TaxID=3346104 RepID=UPI0036305F22